MLVLSRKTGQEVMLDGRIRVRVLEIRGNRVRLGFDAPGDVEIQRAELTVSDSPTLPSEDHRPPVNAARCPTLLVPSA